MDKSVVTAIGKGNGLPEITYTGNYFRVLEDIYCFVIEYRHKHGERMGLIRDTN